MVLPTRQAPAQYASRDAADVLEAVPDVARDEDDAAGTGLGGLIADGPLIEDIWAGITTNSTRSIAGHCALRAQYAADTWTAGPSRAKGQGGVVGRRHLASSRIPSVSLCRDGLVAGHVAPDVERIGFARRRLVHESAVEDDDDAVGKLEKLVEVLAH